MTSSRTKASWPQLPVLKPNEAMIDAAVRAVTGGGRRGRIGLVATFAPTLSSMPAEFPAGVEVIPVLAEGALAALDAGDAATHDRLAVDAARRLGVDLAIAACDLGSDDRVRALDLVGQCLTDVMQQGAPLEELAIQS